MLKYFYIILCLIYKYLYIYIYDSEYFFFINKSEHFPVIKKSLISEGFFYN